ncbi:MAG: TetR/AcrR family transcriptional regulator [Pseudomonadota bacterium]
MTQNSESKKAKGENTAPGRVSKVKAVGSSEKRPRGGRPTKKAAQELDQRILETAADLFASQGFAATSMEQVAAECSAGKDTIYRRYPSKAALFTALIDSLRTQVVTEMDTLMKKGGSPEEQLYRFARFLLSINLRPQLVALNRVALGDAIPSGGLKPPSTAEDPFMMRFAELVKGAQHEGVVAEGDALFIAEQLLYATSIKPLNAAMLGDTRFSEPAEQQKYFDQAWSLFMKGVAPRTRDDKRNG